jgi:hypothetical protein
MRLADRISQCRTPLIVQTAGESTPISLSGAFTHAEAVRNCPTRYVLSDDLTRLCAALAFSKGARTVSCSDLLRVPAESVWLEWCEAPWREELERYGLGSSRGEGWDPTGRRGVLIQADRDGRRGILRTFWTPEGSKTDVLASSMEAAFDFDAAVDSDWVGLHLQGVPFIRVFDPWIKGVDVLRECFRFSYERTWAEYYRSAKLSVAQRQALAHHALGTIAIDVPLIVAFLVLLASRPALPRRPLMLERLNLSRSKAHKVPLLDQIEVSVPILPHYTTFNSVPKGRGGVPRRLHHVRGHLVRRGSRLFWRVPHLRGNARAGVIRNRTVTWNLEPAKPDLVAGPTVQAHLSMHD